MQNGWNGIKNGRGILRRITALLLCLALTGIAVCPGAVRAQDGGKTVRVGWYESPFNQTDKSGRRSGYAYEYQRKVAAYTGWNYEYVEGSWPELMQMLADGEIDLMSDVSFTEERTESMLFSSLPMGTEEYYIFVSPDNREITPDDVSTLNGKRIGVNQGSVQADFFREWAARHRVRAELIELTGPEEASCRMLSEGTLDAYITLDSYVSPEMGIPVCKIGSSDFYFAVSLDRPDLLGELNLALSAIQDENRYYNQELFKKHLVTGGANAYLTAGEAEWLTNHGTVRVGYQRDFLAFCDVDPETGELTGALKEFLGYAADCLANAHIEFQATPYETPAEALEAMARGEVDCVFPANLSSYDGETMDVVMTPPLMTTGVYAFVYPDEESIFAKKEHVIVAVDEGNPNYDSFLLDHFPNWLKVYYPNTEECLKAVADGVADCVLISNHRYNYISRVCDKYRLTTLSTGENLDFCFAVGDEETELYSILAKVTGLVPTSTVNAALSYYIARDARATLADVVKDNLPLVIAVIAAVLLVILFLLLRSLRAEKRARELIAATEIDELTGLYSRNYFFQYANRMYKEHPEKRMDAVVINIEQFHMVNALNGRELGDRILQALGSEIRAATEEIGGIAGRFEADRFDIYCRHREDYRDLFTRLQDRLKALAPNTSVRLRMGVMEWQEGLEPVGLFDRARTACSMARGHHTEHLIVFNDKVRERELYEQRLLNDLGRALDGYEFEVYYQPKYDIQYDPPKLVSAEALVRWQHPELGTIHPDDFIPLLERNGMIRAVDRYVWEQAARQIVRWREEYGVTIPVSVNLSRVDVFDPDLEKTLEGILEFNGLRHEDLKLEVTETAYTENADQVVQVVEALRKKGYVVEMDDFGIGYSSLNMLSSMPVDVLKMDRAFIQNMEQNEKDTQLVALILGIAENLKIPVVAEGVETESQMRLLRQLGCALVQGYYFSPPLHPADFETEIIQKMQPAH